VEYKIFRLDEPVGWYKISFEEVNLKGEIIKPYIKTHGIKLLVLQNMHNGKDTHIRCVKLFSPREHRSYDLTNPKYITVEMSQFECLR
jgi:hypothetical protein